MPTLHHQGEIDSEAADWAVRVDAGGLSPAESRRLEAWLDADRRHRGAFARARAVLHAAGQVRPLTSGGVAKRLDRRMLIVGGGMAAAATVAGLTVLTRRDPAWRIETGVGETRRLTLDDGSIAVIDSRSRATAVLNDRTRALTVDQGEVWVSVAQDASRPLRLGAGPIQARAAAPAELILRLRDAGARLTVISGQIEAWSRDAPAILRRVGPGGELTLAAAGGALTVARLGEDQVRRRLGWREGMLILDGETLAAAAQEFNFYNDRKIEVATSASELRVVGAFRNTDPDGFSAAMHLLFGVGVRRGSDRIRIG